MRLGSSTSRRAGPDHHVHHRPAHKPSSAPLETGRSSWPTCSGARPGGGARLGRRMIRVLGPGLGVAVGVHTTTALHRHRPRRRSRASAPRRTATAHDLPGRLHGDDSSPVRSITSSTRNPSSRRSAWAPLPSFIVRVSHFSSLRQPRRCGSLTPVMDARHHHRSPLRRREPSNRRGRVSVLEPHRRNAQGRSSCCQRWSRVATRRC